MKIRCIKEEPGITLKGGKVALVPSDFKLGQYYEITINDNYFDIIDDNGELHRYKRNYNSDRIENKYIATDKFFDFKELYRKLKLKRLLNDNQETRT